jgi:hypothetical protein
MCRKGGRRTVRSLAISFFVSRSCSRASCTGGRVRLLSTHTLVGLPSASEVFWLLSTQKTQSRIFTRRQRYRSLQVHTSDVGRHALHVSLERQLLLGLLPDLLVLAVVDDVDSALGFGASRAPGRKGSASRTGAACDWSRGPVCGGCGAPARDAVGRETEARLLDLAFLALLAADVGGTIVPLGAGLAPRHETVFTPTIC